MGKSAFIFLILSLTLPAITLVVGFRNRHTLLWLFVAAGLFFDISISFTRRVLVINHYWAANLSVLSEFLFISCIYQKRFFRKSPLFILTIFVCCACFLISTFSDSVWKFNTTGASLFYLTYIVYAIVGLYIQLREQKVIFLERSGDFWMNTAFIIYGSGNFLLFLFTDYLKSTNTDLFRTLWSTSFLLLNIVVNILLAIALSRKETAENESE